VCELSWHVAFGNAMFIVHCVGLLVVSLLCTLDCMYTRVCMDTRVSSTDASFGGDDWGDFTAPSDAGFTADSGAADATAQHDWSAFDDTPASPASETLPRSPAQPHPQTPAQILPQTPPQPSPSHALSPSTPPSTSLAHSSSGSPAQPTAFQAVSPVTAAPTAQRATPCEQTNAVPTAQALEALAERGHTTTTSIAASPSAAANTLSTPQQARIPTPTPSPVGVAVSSSPLPPIVAASQQNARPVALVSAVPSTPPTPLATSAFAAPFNEAASAGHLGSPLFSQHTTMERFTPPFGSPILSSGAVPPVLPKTPPLSVPWEMDSVAPEHAPESATEPQPQQQAATTEKLTAEEPPAEKITPAVHEPLTDKALAGEPAQVVPDQASAAIVEQVAAEDAPAAQAELVSGERAASASALQASGPLTTDDPQTLRAVAQEMPPTESTHQPSTPQLTEEPPLDSLSRPADAPSASASAISSDTVAESCSTDSPACSDTVPPSGESVTTADGASSTREGAPLAAGDAEEVELSGGEPTPVLELDEAAQSNFSASPALTVEAPFRVASVSPPLEAAVSAANLLFDEGDIPSFGTVGAVSHSVQPESEETTRLRKETTALKEQVTTLTSQQQSEKSMIAQQQGKA
jgi:hypothetical protein